MKSIFKHRQNSEASKYLIIIVWIRENFSTSHLIFSDIIFVCSAQVHNEFSFSSIYQTTYRESRGDEDGIEALSMASSSSFFLAVVAIQTSK